MSLRPSAAANEYELLIYGDIGESWWGESVTAQSVVQQLIALADTVTQINVRINSYGGSVADGLAIFNALKRHPATKAVTIDGVAMSIASLIAMAGDTVEMPPESILMIHAPWGGIMGNAQELREYANILDTYAEAMSGAYETKSGKPHDEVLALLQDGKDHYFTGTQAVAEGFADSTTAGVGGDDADDESKAMAAALLHRYAPSLNSAPGGMANLAIAAAMRARNPLSRQPAAPQAAPAANTTEEAPTMPTPTNSPAAGASDRAAILAADKQRREAIRAAFAPFAARKDLDPAALAKLQTECEDEPDCDAAGAGLRLLALLGKSTEPLNAAQPRVEAGRLDETVTYREGAVQAVMHRRNPSANAMDERSTQFRGMNLVDLARDCVERAGTRTRSMSRAEIAIKALQSTSDFPFILENVITKTLRAGYASSARTFTPWSRLSMLPDFKQISRVQLGGAPNLKRVVEGGEYEYGTIGEGAEKYSVQKYGKIVPITWETIINDDLDALTRIPQAFGASAADLESDIVYAIVTANANMADGVPLFHATHGNLGTAAALANALNPAVANPVAEMRMMMTLQRGIEGRYITVRPRYLIVPPDLEETALKVTNATVLPAKNVDVNVVGVTLTPIVEPRLHDASTTAWFGAAEPATVDTVEYAYLEGHEAVFTETRAGFDVDGVQVKCRHVFGAKAIDHRGLFKNAGQ